MVENIKAYQKILFITTHVSFICYTLGYIMGMLDYYTQGITNLFIEDVFIVSVFIITYLLFIFKITRMQTSMMILGTLVVADLLYPGIILNSHVPYANFHEETVAMLLILMFVTPFTTNRKFSIIIIVSSITIVITSALVHNDEMMLDALPVIALCLGGMGIFSIVFENLIRNMLIQLQQSKERIKALSDYKQKIIRYVIHDLRVPVNTILNLNASCNGEVPLKIQEQAYKINDQLENVLDVERLEAPNLSLKKENILIAEIVTNAVKSVEVLASEKQIRINSLYKVSGSLLCDIELTERMLINLLTNAIKYSPNNALIEIVVDGKDDICEITVTDNGRGIAEEHQRHIFEKFYFVKSDKSKSSFSTGLGLAFCKLVIDAHHGSIELKSEVGKGTTFLISLPCFTSLAEQNEFKSSSPLQIYLTQAEKESIHDLCLVLSETPVYMLSQIVKLLKSVEKTNHPGLKQWHKRMSDAVYAGNEKAFHELINICLS